MINSSLRPTVLLLLLVLLAAAFGCDPSSPGAADTPLSAPAAESITFDEAPKATDEVECAELISDEEVGAILEAAEVTALGLTHSSCSWFADDVFFQLVLNTNDGYPDWRQLLLEEYTEVLQVTDDLELRGDPANGSFAAFGPDRGLLLHGLGSRDDALQLLLLAISRL